MSTYQANSPDDQRQTQYAQFLTLLVGLSLWAAKLGLRFSPWSAVFSLILTFLVDCFKPELDRINRWIRGVEDWR